MKTSHLHNAHTLHTPTPSQVESDTAHSMQTLVELDRVKQRMLQSRTALQEADNWTTLSENVEEVFATGDVQKVSQLIVGCHGNCQIYQTMGK